MSLILTSFIIIFVAQVVSWIGESVLSGYAYSVYLWATKGSLVQRQRLLKRDILKNKQELLQTSAQDQFAKWAKLRRSVDKGLSELEKTNSELATGKTTFTVSFRVLLWLVVNLPQFYMTWSYRSKPVFWLPQGWFGPVSWWLSFPFAPKGSVSIMTWTWACRHVLNVAGTSVQQVILPLIVSNPATEEQVDEKKQRQDAKVEPIPVAEVD